MQGSFGLFQHEFVRAAHDDADGLALSGDTGHLDEFGLSGLLFFDEIGGHEVFGGEVIQTSNRPASKRKD